jgi:hypothetical protein
VETELKRSIAPLFTEKTSRTTSTIAAAPTIDTSPSRQKVKIVKLGILCGVVALLMGGLWALNHWRLTPRPSNTLTSPTTTELALTYSVTVQKYRDNKPFEPPFQLAKEMLFESDYQIRLNISSQQSGFLYVLNEGPHDKEQPADFVVLFPSPTSNGGSALVSESQPIQIPEKSWIKFDKEKGTERVWLVFAPNAVPELEPIRSYASAKTRGLITDAGLRITCSSFFGAMPRPNLRLRRASSGKKPESYLATPFSFTSLTWNISNEAASTDSTDYAAQAGRPSVRQELLVSRQGSYLFPTRFLSTMPGWYESANADESIKPGVKRGFASGTPGTGLEFHPSP